MLLVGNDGAVWCIAGDVLQDFVNSISQGFKLSVVEESVVVFSPLIDSFEIRLEGAGISYTINLSL